MDNSMYGQNVFEWTMKDNREDKNIKHKQHFRAGNMIKYYEILRKISIGNKKGGPDIMKTSKTRTMISSKDPTSENNNKNNQKKTHQKTKTIVNIKIK